MLYRRSEAAGHDVIVLERRLGAVMFALVAALIGAGCGSSDSSSRSASSSPGSNTVTTTTLASTTTTPSSSATTQPERTVDDAIGTYVRSVGHDYAGDCGDTTLGEDVGKKCSMLQQDRGAARIYALGPAFSEFDTWLLVQHREDGWSVTDSASAGTLDNPTPPPW